MPSCPWLESGGTPWYLLGQRQVKSGYFLDDLAPPEYD
jgi:hypothetical protein